MDDVVGRIREQWEQQRPELDVSSIDVIGRVIRLAALVTQVNEGALASEGLARSEFEVLSALKRAGGALRPSELTRETLSSGAATTKRLARLAGEGLIIRTPSARDRREVEVRLSDTGAELIDRLFPEQLDRERGVVEALDEAERDQLAALLRKVLSSLDVSPR